MSHSPYGRNPKSDKQSPPTGKVTTPEEARANIAREPVPFEVTPEEAAAVIAMRDAAERWQLDPARVAQLAAKALFLASDVTSLGAEFARVLAKLSPEVKEQYRAQLDSLARAYLDSRADHGFGGTDFPPATPGPDEGRPQ